MTPMATDQAVVRIERTIQAAPAQVYRAWLDPDVLRQWLSAESLTVTHVEVDERVGGHHRTWQAGPDGDAGGFDCELLELVPNERIVFLWRFVGPERVADPTHDSRLTISLREAPGGATQLSLVHERLEAITAAMPGMGGKVATGWGMALDKLEATMGDGAAAG